MGRPCAWGTEHGRCWNSKPPPCSTVLQLGCKSLYPETAGHTVLNNVSQQPERLMTDPVMLYRGFLPRELVVTRSEQEEAYGASFLLRLKQIVKKYAAKVPGVLWVRSATVFDPF